MKFIKLLKAGMVVSGWHQNRDLFIHARTCIIHYLRPKYFLQVCSGTTSRIVLLVVLKVLNRFLTKRITLYLILPPLHFEMRDRFVTATNWKKITTHLNGVYRGQFIQYHYWLSLRARIL